MGQSWTIDNDDISTWFLFWRCDVSLKNKDQLGFLTSIKFSTITQCGGEGLIFMLEELLYVTLSALTVG